ncbi:hypothetical protein ACVW16_001249 [Bradyrhizobium sp. USDA 4474]
MSDTNRPSKPGVNVTAQEHNAVHERTFRARAFVAAYALAVGVATAGWLYTIVRAALKLAGWLLG